MGRGRERCYHTPGRLDRSALGWSRSGQLDASILPGFARAGRHDCQGVLGEAPARVRGAWVTLLGAFDHGIVRQREGNKKPAESQAGLMSAKGRGYARGLCVVAEVVVAHRQAMPITKTIRNLLGLGVELRGSSISLRIKSFNSLFGTLVTYRKRQIV